MALSGCASAVDGAAAPLGMHYRGNLTGGTSLEDLAERDKARLLDPCGMLDESAVNALGHTLYFGIGQELDECVVRLDRATLTQGVTTLGVSLSVLPDFSGDQFQLGNRRASMRRSDDMCFIALEYNNHRAFHYSATAHPGIDPCTPLRAVVTASAPLLERNALRANSTRMPKTRGGTEDPCAALDTGFDAKQKFYLRAFSAYQCDAWLGDYTSNDSNRFSIAIINVAKTQATYVPSQARKLLLAGVDSVEENGPSDHCIIRAYVGVGQPFTTRGWNGTPEDRIEAVRVSGPGCTETRKLAVAAVKAYQD
ncbi:hypothetical protein [Nocardia abscessus]|uniref:hypothetical protein n=1 Tax=Nocardia abscessus TaxID=120957 RepID=UPI002457A339|nr:hypothetical protein [Nocardia abscessus]